VGPPKAPNLVPAVARGGRGSALKMSLEGTQKWLAACSQRSGSNWMVKNTEKREKTFLVTQKKKTNTGGLLEEKTTLGGGVSLRRETKTLLRCLSVFTLGTKRKRKAG